MTIALGMPGTPAAGTPAARSPQAPAAPATGRPPVPALVDRYGRVASDLRVSLLDRCNLRCTYCMPEEGLPFLEGDALMRIEELERLIGIAVRLLGVRKVRLTGGEPLLRPELPDLVARIARLRPRPEIALTTNGIGLASRAGTLRQAGLDRLNVSLDTLHADVFAAMTRRPFLRQVMQGIDAALQAGFEGMKLNAVLLRGVNDAEAVPLVEWALARGLELRFIEQMPLDADRSWQRTELITAAEIREALQTRYTLQPHPVDRSGAPAERYTVMEAGEERGVVGIIASVTEPFCDACRRTRLTAEGRVRSCLFSHDESDLLGPLRSGASDEEIAELWRGAMWGKPAGHGLADPEFRQPSRTMSAIGG